ncbi:carboxylesterase family protein [Tsukamurella sp. 8F]|uniref:carboxylesterase/lipase family protein n=1 Tax=unclassified Tsukamurella TaxID=2633480 RepID=UPI0023B9576E|nr:MULTISPECIES: carboxylesterase family protein [unclassified Tsukamurella]MDF0528451.1 carboxylesterase family protein [Tsukamurella sp. 8J]MDF0586276.1 carboxylesterase family protein [Tsukamurella sp. 8F]
MREQPRVRTLEGVVEGRHVRGNAVFRGIPYAQPPVGELRFAAPQPVPHWDGVRPASDFGPPPPQSGPTQAEASDDTNWLTVNVCTPDPDRHELPVLVWLCCGGYMAGTAADPMFDPTALATEGVVVVSVQCRMGAEGFALLDGAPSNRGLLDQIAALEWIRRNIAAFGGDPDAVTIAGTSGGAGSVAALLTIPRARALFRRAIAHSAPGLHITPALAAQVTAALAERLGVASTAAGFTEVPPQRLADEVTALCVDSPAHREQWGRLARIGIVVCPVIDGDLLRVTPWTALETGRAAGVDLLVGHMRDEFRLFSVMMGVRGTFTEKDAATALEVFAPGDPAQYRAAYPDATAEQMVETVYSDATFRMPSVLLAEANTAAGGASYLFEIQWATEVYGACHSIDVPLAFGTLDSPTGILFFGENPPHAIHAVSRELLQAWIRFCTTGDPGWPRYDGDGRATRILDTPSTTAPYPEERSRRLWHGRPPAPFAPA